MQDQEAHFWLRLEFRLCAEFAEMSDRELRSYWCDGILPEQYRLIDFPPRIAGRIWICCGRKQERWKFALILPGPIRSRDEIVWDSLLPPDNATQWLTIDRERKWIEIEPGIAILDED